MIPETEKIRQEEIFEMDKAESSYTRHLRTCSMILFGASMIIMLMNLVALVMNTYSDNLPIYVLLRISYAVLLISMILSFSAIIYSMSSKKFPPCVDNSILDDIEEGNVDIRSHNDKMYANVQVVHKSNGIMEKMANISLISFGIGILLIITRIILMIIYG